MGSVVVESVPNPATSRDFFELPWHVNQSDPDWVAPLRMAQRKLLDRRHYPFFKHGNAAFFVASRGVVVAAIVQLQANWRSDYRNNDGIELRDGEVGPELVIEDSSRVDPWIIRQIERLRSACLEQLRMFAVEEGTAP
jgi:hypothetical protein